MLRTRHVLEMQMKNNTLAVALAAMLVGGVATAGYMNSRDNNPAVPVQAPPAQAYAPMSSQLPGLEPAALDAGLAPAGRVEYAEVVDVDPVTERERLYATVIGSSPVREQSTSNNPQQVCEDLPVTRRLPERDGNVGGTVAGAVIGGLVGNQIGGGNGKKAATVGGAVAGGFIGNRVDRNHVGGRVVQDYERRCRTVNNPSTSSRTVAWDVTYRNPDGSTGTMRTGSKPGSRIAMGDANRTVGYDVSYRYRGEVRNVRMEERPGARLPMIDGQVVTQIAAASGTDRG